MEDTDLLRTVAAPPLPFTLPAGSAGLDTLKLTVRSRGWILLVVFGGWGLVGLVLAGPAGLIGPTVLVAGVLAIIGLVAVQRAVYARSTITVTHTELVVKQVRSRVQPRDRVDEMVLGFFTTRPGVAALQVAITTREGKAFARLPAMSWSGEGLAQVATALEISPREQTDADRRRLVPFWYRHLYLTAFAGAFVLVAVIIGAIVLADHLRAAHRAEAVRTARSGFDSYAAQRLTADQVPGLRSVTRRAYTVDEEDAVSLHVEVLLTSGRPEIDPDRYAAIEATICAFRPDLGGVQLRTSTEVALDHGGTGETGREIQTSCELPPAPVRSWLTYAAAHPLGPGVRRVVAGQEEFGLSDGFRISVYISAGDVSTFRSVLGEVCAYRPQGEVGRGISWIGRDVASSRHLDHVSCADPAAAQRKWTTLG